MCWFGESSAGSGALKPCFPVQPAPPNILDEVRGCCLRQLLCGDMVTLLLLLCSVSCWALRAVNPAHLTPCPLP